MPTVSKISPRDAEDEEDRYRGAQESRGGTVNTAARGLVALALCANAGCAPASQHTQESRTTTPPLRMAVVFADTFHDRLYDSLAALTRGELRAVATSANIRVLTPRDVDVLQGGGDMTWNALDSREIMKIIPASLIVDFTIVERTPTVSVLAIAHYLRGAPDTMQLFRARNIEGAATLIAQHIASESVPRARRELTAFTHDLPKRVVTDYPYFEFQVVRQAAYIPDDSVHPRPTATPTDVVVQLVVDTLGIPENGSLKIIKGASDAVSDSARRAMHLWRFTPAYSASGKVRQLVQMYLQH